MSKRVAPARPSQGRLTGWKEKIFGRRYQAIIVSDEEAAQVERLRYCLAHGAKEDLVDRPRDWPGVHCVRALLEGEVLEGLWFDRTQEYLARRRGEKFEPFQYATREVLNCRRRWHLFLPRAPTLVDKPYSF
jgi:hypothetical protein